MLSILGFAKRSGVILALAGGTSMNLHLSVEMPDALLDKAQPVFEERVPPTPSPAEPLSSAVTSLHLHLQKVEASSWGAYHPGAWVL